MDMLKQNVKKFIVSVWANTQDIKLGISVIREDLGKSARIVKFCYVLWFYSVHVLFYCISCSYFVVDFSLCLSLFENTLLLSHTTHTTIKSCHGSHILQFQDINYCGF